MDKIINIRSKWNFIKPFENYAFNDLLMKKIYHSFLIRYWALKKTPIFGGKILKFQYYADC